MNIKTDCPSGPQGSLGVVMVPSGWIWPEGVRHGPSMLSPWALLYRGLLIAIFRIIGSLPGFYGHYAVGVYFIITPQFILIHHSYFHHE